jgi:hypothetical protein
VTDQSELREELPIHDETHCVRMNKARELSEHLECPYCHGKAVDVANGNRASFCSFVPGEDPINFGFPEGTTRNTGG